MGKTVIKPCPCCGHEPILNQLTDNKWYYYCPNLGCPGNVTTDAYLNKSSATRAWNTRHDSTVTKIDKNDRIYLYAARDTATSKLVSDITNPRRKYWDKRGNAQSAIDYYNRSYANKKLNYGCNKGEHGLLELVVFELVEVKEDNT